jgi:hypothetical protein
MANANAVAVAVYRRFVDEGNLVRCGLQSNAGLHSGLMKRFTDKSEKFNDFYKQKQLERVIVYGTSEYRLKLH